MRKVCLFIAFLSVIWSVCVGGSLNWDHHHTNEEVKKILDGVQSECPDRTRVYSLPDPQIETVPGIPDKTDVGSKLWVIQFSPDLTQDHIKGVPDFKYVGNMHGNEVVGKEILLRLAVLMCDVLNDNVKELASKYWTVEDIKWLLDNTNIHILPSLNPDGWAAANAVEDKTSRDAWLIGRNNSNNVDLNRNFPELDKKYYLTEEQPGHHNNHLERLEKMLKDDTLEAETRMAMAWIAQLPWVLSSNMHGGDLVANYPFDEARPGKKGQSSLTPDDALFKELALSYSKAHTEMSSMDRKSCDMTNDDFSKQGGTTNGAGWYSVAKGMQDYNYLASNCFEITLELGCVKFPSGEELPNYWHQNFDAMINFMFQTHLGIKGSITVPDEFAHIPVVIKVYEENGNYIDHDILSTKYGDYFRLLNPGMYTIEAVLNIPPNDELPNGKKCVLAKDVELNHYPVNWSTAKRLDFKFIGDKGKLLCRKEVEEVLEERQQKDEYLNYLYRILSQKAYNRDRYRNMY